MTDIYTTDMASNERYAVLGNGHAQQISLCPALVTQNPVACWPSHQWLLLQLSWAKGLRIAGKALFLSV